MRIAVFTKKGLMMRQNNIRRDPGKIVLALLNHPVEIDPGVTVRDIFLAVEARPALMKFISMYSDCQKIKEFMAEVKKPAPAYKGKHYVRICKKAETYGGLVVYSRWWMVRNSTEYGLSYTALDAIAHVPVKLHKKITVPNPEGGKYEPLLKNVEIDLTLLDVLHAIFYDISWQGGAKDRKAFIEELNSLGNKIVEEETKTYAMPKQSAKAKLKKRAPRAK